MRAAAEPLGGELGEPALDEIEPTRIGRREVQGEARMAYQPALDRGRLVGRGIVDDQVYAEVCGHRLVDDAEEPVELLGALVCDEVGDDLAGRDV